MPSRRSRHHHRRHRRPTPSTIHPSLPAAALPLLFLLLSPPTSSAMHEDEAGRNDFTLATAGHGWGAGIEFAALSSAGDALITAGGKGGWGGGYYDEDLDASPAGAGAADAGGAFFLGGTASGGGGGGGGGCHLSSRSTTTGALLWRRDACSGGGGSSSSANDDPTAAPSFSVRSSPTSGTVYTLDSLGTFRGWDDATGALLFDVREGGSSTSNSEENEEVASTAAPQPRILLAESVSSSSSAAPATTVVGTVSTLPPSGGGGGKRRSDVLILRDPRTGSGSSPLRAGEDILLAAKVKPGRGGGGRSTARILGMIALDDPDVSLMGGSRAVVLAGWTHDDDGGGAAEVGSAAAAVGSMAMLEVGVVAKTLALPIATDADLDGADAEATTISAGIEAVPIKSHPVRVADLPQTSSSSNFLVSTARIFSTAANGEGTNGDGGGGRTLNLLAVTPGGRSVLSLSFGVAPSGGDIGKGTGHEFTVPFFHPLWTSIRSIVTVPSSPSDFGGYGYGKAGYVTVSGNDNRYPRTRATTALFEFDPKTGKIGDQVVYHVGPDKVDDGTTYEAVVGGCGRLGLVVEREGGWNSGPASIKAFVTPEKEEGTGTAALDVAGTSRFEGVDANVADLRVLRCEEGGGGTMTALATARGGTTTMLEVKLSGKKAVEVETAWTAEEALGSVTSAVFLDESGSHHLLSEDGDKDDDEEEESLLLESLTFPSRLRSQISSLAGGKFLSDLSSALTLTAQDTRDRDYEFGFAKVAVLLSGPMDRIMAIDATPPSSAQGAVLWRYDLNPKAAWHRIVHGGQTLRTLVHGGQDMHGLHGHEVLVVSYVPPPARPGGKEEGADAPPAAAAGGGTAEWTCLDGLRGRVHSSGSVPLPSSIAQVVPVHSHGHQHHPGESSGGGCRQLAALLLEDDTVTVLPDTDGARSVLADAVAAGDGAAGRNGLYVHTVNGGTGSFRSLRLDPKASSSEGGDVHGGGVEATLAGETTFDPRQERIVTVAYPQRNEVVQSPSVILGDDSLLLKYLNPHLCVVVTVATDEFLAEVGGDSGGEGTAEGLDAFYAAHRTGSAGAAAGATKPLGATEPGEDVPPSAAAASSSSSSSSSPPPPSLFVNLVDSVSGRVLHRTSHAHVAPGGGDGGTANVPVLISENWVVYAYTNARTRRTELGVLSLHEGMIDKAGITAFRAPDQERTFSSFTGPRPIVLGRTYAFPAPVSAIGVTTTRGGISLKHVVLATGVEGRVVTVDRRMLDPRRPTGEVKQSEKVEGLHRYHPLIPLVSLRTPSYFKHVGSATSIVSTSATVESQSLILAYGGPDIFFARLSPSKGFDLLPDSFNRALLSVVVLGLVVLVGTVKKMSSKKMVATSWS